MIGRISYNKFHNDVEMHIRNKNANLSTQQNQIASQKKVLNPRENPIAISQGSRYASSIRVRELYATQNRKLYDTFQAAEGSLRQSIEIFQRSRELSIQAANGYLANDDRTVMAEEVNQLIDQLVSVVNQKSGDGNFLFGGTSSQREPFRALQTASNRLRKDVITQVEYTGSNRVSMVEISENELIPHRLAGNEVFWANKSRITGGASGLTYSLGEDAVVKINDHQISLSQGDSIYAIVEKINAAPVAVQASIDSVTGALSIESTKFEQLWLEDEQGNVLQDLQVIESPFGPYNVHPNALNFQESIFDVLIRLRDSLFEDNYELAGGRALGTIDKGLESILNSMGKMGAYSERLSFTYERIERYEIPNFTRQYDESMSIDLAQATVRYSELQVALQAAYKVGTDIMTTSLLQYLR